MSNKDAYPIPNVTFDLLSGYWQLGMTERAKERSAFCTCRGFVGDMLVLLER